MNGAAAPEVTPFGIYKASSYKKNIEKALNIPSHKGGNAPEMLRGHTIRDKPWTFSKITCKDCIPQVFSHLFSY